MQRKVHSRNKSNDEYTKVNGRMINIIFTTVKCNGAKVIVRDGGTSIWNFYDLIKGI